MGISVGFHKSLFKLGRFRFGIRYRAKGISGLIMLLVYGFMNFCWYAILGSLWLMYGIIWLFFILPIKLVRMLINQKKKEDENNI